MERGSARLLVLMTLAAGLVATGAAGSPPDLTGKWHGQGSPPTWTLTSGSGGSSLTGHWYGTGAHSHLRGTFTSTLNSDGSSYSGTFSITEDTNHVHGTITIKVVSASRVTLTLVTNGSPSTFDLFRAAQKVPKWSYRGYANDVKVHKPLVGPYQLGVSHSEGNGVGGAGTVGTRFQEKDPGRFGGPYSFTAKVTGYSYHESAHGSTKRLVLDVTMTTANAKNCAPGDTGTLTLIDSKKPLSNGQPSDKAEYAWDNGRCPTFVQGWINADGGPKTSPQKGGPPHGGQWAIVTIG